jgi:hypothetical protein
MKSKYQSWRRAFVEPKRHPQITQITQIKDFDRGETPHPSAALERLDTSGD